MTQSPPALLGNPSPQDAEWLLGLWPKLVKDREAKGIVTPVRSLRIVSLLPEVFQSHDGRSYRYLKALKNASSSIVRMLLDIVGEGQFYQELWGESTGERFLSPTLYKGRKEFVSVNGANLRLHKFFFEKPFNPKPLADIRFCVVRDPVERFVSIYLNRLVRMRGQKAPSFEEFVRELTQEYIKINIEKGIVKGAKDKHFTSQTFYLGQDAQYYTHIFTMRQLDELVALLSDLSGKPLSLPRRNSSVQFEKPDITPRVRDIIAEAYQCDYKVFGAYF